MLSLIAITPAYFKNTAEALGLAMGHSGQEFSVSISSGTYYGLHAWVSEQDAKIWTGEVYPEVGYSHEQIDVIRNTLIISVTDMQPLDHLEKVLQDNNLVLDVFEDSGDL